MCTKNAYGNDLLLCGGGVWALARHTVQRFPYFNTICSYHAVSTPQSLGKPAN